jgi:hypothetical protein
VIGLPEPFVRLAPFPENQFRVADGIETVDLPTIEVARGITIAGRLIDLQDQPIADAQVFIPGGAYAITDQQGYFKMLSAPPGPKVTYRAILSRQEKTSFGAQIVRESPLLLRVPVDNTERAGDRVPVRARRVEAQEGR